MTSISELQSGFFKIGKCSVAAYQRLVGVYGDASFTVPLDELRVDERPFPFRALKVGQAFHVPKTYANRNMLNQYVQRAQRGTMRRFTIHTSKHSGTYEVCRIE